MGKAQSIQLSEKFIEVFRPYVRELVRQKAINVEKVELPTFLDIFIQSDDLNVGGVTGRRILATLIDQYVTIMWRFDVPRQELIKRVEFTVANTEGSDHLMSLCDTHEKNTEETIAKPGDKNSPDKVFAKAINDWVNHHLMQGDISMVAPFLTFAEQLWLFYGAAYWFMPNNREDAVTEGSFKLYQTDPSLIVAQNHARTNAAKNDGATPQFEDGMKFYKSVLKANFKDRFVKAARLNAKFVSTAVKEKYEYTIKSATSNLKPVDEGMPPEIIPHMVIHEFYSLLKEEAEKTPVLIVADSPMYPLPKKRVISFDYKLHEQYGSIVREPISQPLHARAYLPVLGAPRYTLGMTRVDAFHVLSTKKLVQGTEEALTDDQVDYYVAKASTDVQEILLERLAVWAFDDAEYEKSRFRKPEWWNAYISFFRNAKNPMCHKIDDSCTPIMLQSLIKYLSQDEKAALARTLPPNVMQYGNNKILQVFNDFTPVQPPPLESAVAARNNLVNILEDGIYKIIYYNQEDKLNSTFCTLNWNVLDYLADGKLLRKEPAYMRVLTLKYQYKTDNFSNDKWWVTGSGEVIGSGLAPSPNSPLRDFKLRLGKPSTTIDHFSKKSTVYDVSVKEFEQMLQVANVQIKIADPSSLLLAVSQVEHIAFDPWRNIEEREQALLNSDMVTVRNVFASPYSYRGDSIVQISARKIVDIVRVAKRSNR